MLSKMTCTSLTSHFRGSLTYSNVVVSPTYPTANFDREMSLFLLLEPLSSPRTMDRQLRPLLALVGPGLIITQTVN